MNLHPHRPWITPLVIGSFLLLSVTGVLMFFHLNSGLNKTAHQWLSWAMVGGVALHVALNLPAFKRYFIQRTSRWVIALFVILLALSFVPLKESKKAPSYASSVRALTQTPIATLAQVADTSPEEMRTRLEDAGLSPTSDTQSISDLMETDLRAQTSLLDKVLKPAKK
jgi:uncharacterized membrane protein SirB2